MEQKSDFSSFLREDAIDIHLSTGDLVRAPSQAADFFFDFARDDVLQFQKNGDDLVIILNNGSSVHIMGYYLNSYENALVFTDTVDAGLGVSPLIMVGGGLLGLSGLAMASGGGEDRTSGSTITVNNTGGDDGIINATERNDGILLSGTATPGSQVTVIIGNATRETISDNGGNWGVFFEVDDIPVGEKDIQVLVSGTDPDGNVVSTTSIITLDTFVNTLNFDGVPGGSDETVNADEAEQGLTITGDVEPGSTVVVQFDGHEYIALVNDNGDWTVDIPSNNIPDSNGAEFSLSAIATDVAGNTLTINDTFSIDTEAPTAPIVEAIHQTLSGIEGVTTPTPEEGSATFFQVSGTGEITDVTITEQTTSASRSETDYSFSSVTPAGNDLILSVQDLVGNIRSTYQVFNNGTAGSAVSMNNPALGSYDIDAISLFFADEANLILTEADIANLSSEIDGVTVFGGDDDTVTLIDAQRNGSVVIKGEIFEEYSLGNTTVWVDEFIDVVV